MKNRSIVSVKIILIILFICAVFKLPYGYYEFIRVVGMTGFILLAYFESDKADKTYMIIWICSAIIINPIFKIGLIRPVWIILDIFWIIFIIITLYYNLKELTKSNNT
ncbi:MAG TPA: hypothetical protein PLG90_04175 [Ignavibacteria bacterium]|nr:hypothetical protein [Ignavibacteria bacterium]